MCMRDTKPSEKVQYELDGEPCSLYKLVVAEPGWAVSRINYSVDRIAELEHELAIGVNNVIRGLETENLSLKKEVDNTGEIVDKLDEQLRIRGERMEQLYAWINPEYMEKCGQSITYIRFSSWFDDNGKAPQSPAETRKQETSANVRGKE